MEQRDHLPPAPLPGTEPPTRALFVDRWGTLLHKPDQGFCTHYDQVEFQEGATDALFRAQQANWILYLLGNEESVAFGKLAEATWLRIENSLIEELSGLGITIQKSYSCVDHPEGKPPHDKDSVFLLPNTGAFYHASQHEGISLRESWVIGDGAVELAAGWRAGCHVGLVTDDSGQAGSDLHVDAEISGRSLAEVVRQIVGISSPHVV